MMTTGAGAGDEAKVNMDGAVLALVGTALRAGLATVAGTAGGAAIMAAIRTGTAMGVAMVIISAAGTVTTIDEPSPQLILAAF